MSKKSRALVLMGMVAVCCAVMLWIDGVAHPPYAVKSAAKVALFLLAPLLYRRLDRDFSPKALFSVKKESFLPALGLGLAVFAVIFGGYFLLRGVADFSAITGLLEENIGVRKENFLAVSVYIAFVNSLLEEFFFRGFAFFTLKDLLGRPAAYVFSALAFAVYHTAMMLGWWDWWLFALALLGLFLGGAIFNFLNERTGTLWPSWMVHMCANFAINAVGCILFGIL